MENRVQQQRPQLSHDVTLSIHKHPKGSDITLQPRDARLNVGNEHTADQSLKQETIHKNSRLRGCSAGPAGLTKRMITSLPYTKVPMREGRSLPLRDNAETVFHLLNANPRIAGYPVDDLREHLPEGLLGGLVGQRRRGRRRKQRPHVGEEAWIGQLREHTLLGLRPRNRLPGLPEISGEERDETRGIETLEDIERVGKVVEVSPFVPL